MTAATPAWPNAWHRVPPGIPSTNQYHQADPFSLADDRNVRVSLASRAPRQAPFRRHRRRPGHTSHRRDRSRSGHAGPWDRAALRPPRCRLLESKDCAVRAPPPPRENIRPRIPDLGGMPSVARDWPGPITACAAAETAARQEPRRHPKCLDRRIRRPRR
jgi:hypothetical protein